MTFRPGENMFSDWLIGSFAIVESIDDVVEIKLVSLGADMHLVTTHTSVSRVLLRA